jgi:porin
VRTTVWGIGFFHFGLTEPLLAGLAALDVNRRSEGGVEAFYNLAITPWSRATYAALRLQTKF